MENKKTKHPIKHNTRVFTTSGTGEAQRWQKLAEKNSYVYTVFLDSGRTVHLTNALVFEFENEFLDFDKKVTGFGVDNKNVVLAVASQTEHIKREKPPLGIMSKANHQILINKERHSELCAAISRYYAKNLKIPIEWIEEYNELIDELKD